MAESLAALGVAANIFQFVELGLKVTKVAVDTYRSTDIHGLAERNVDLGVLTTDLKQRCNALHGDESLRTDKTMSHLLSRCGKTADKLLKELESLKIAVEKRQQRWTRTVTAIKASLKREKIEGLQEEIVGLRREIFDRLQHLLYNHRISLSGDMRSLEEASKAWNNATEQKLSAMTRTLERLVQQNSTSDPTESRAFFADELSKFVQDANNRGAVRSILLALHFNQIKERQNEIPKAHRNTFEWIFDDAAAVSFPAWLQDQAGGVLWITGKPGSGKSTLMKLILGHEKTTFHAKAWAQSKPLVIASHFFWLIGTRLQKSQEGLLRTLLFQILSQCPEIVPEVCAERWTSSFRQMESWSIEELTEVLERIQSHKSLPCRILLLVDGMDEYTGEIEKLTMFLRAMSRWGTIKVCCASRPWPQFARAFGDSPWQLQIHQLTAGDMRLYVRETLMENHNFLRLQSSQKVPSDELIEEISKRSEGVFFWVSLVTKSLLRGLDNHDTIRILRQRLAELPSDLFDFFQRMLNSIEGVYQSDAYSLFALLLTANTSLPLDLFVMNHDRVGLNEPRTFSEAAFRGNLFTSFSAEPKKKREWLLALCRDLVQSWNVSGVTPLDVRLGFLHRTVVEFLHGQKKLQEFISDLPCARYGPRHLLVWAYYDIVIRNELEPLPTHHDELVLRMIHMMQNAETFEKKDALLTFLSLLTDLDPFSGDLRNEFNLATDDLPEQQAILEFRYLLDYSKAKVSLELSAAHHTSPEAWEHIIMRKYPHRTLYCWRMVMAILWGTPDIQVGESTSVTRHTTIDLGLLSGILDLFNVDFQMMEDGMEWEELWRQFVTDLAGPTVSGEPSQPMDFRNVLGACKILIEHGAPQFFEISLSDGTDGLSRRIDTQQVFRKCGFFGEDDLEELLGLYRPVAEVETPRPLTSRILNWLFVRKWN